MEFDTQISPIVNSWIDILAFDRFQSDDLRSEKETLWRDMRAAIIQFSPAGIKKILLTHSTLVSIIINHITLETFQENRVVWSSACECAEKFVRDCGGMVWQGTYFSLPEILDILYEVIVVIMENLLYNFDDFIRAYALVLELLYGFEDWPAEFQLKLQSTIEIIVTSTHPLESTPYGRKFNKIMERIVAALECKLKVYIFGILPVHIAEKRTHLISTVIQFYCSILKCSGVSERPGILRILFSHIGDIAIIPSIAVQASVDADVGGTRNVLSLLDNLFHCACEVLHLLPSYTQADVDTTSSQPDELFAASMDLLPPFLLCSYSLCQVTALRLLVDIDRRIAASSRLRGLPRREISDNDDMNIFILNATPIMLCALIVSVIRTYGSLSRGGVLQQLSGPTARSVFSAADGMAEQCLSAAATYISRTSGRKASERGVDMAPSDTTIVRLDELVRDCVQTKGLASKLLQRHLSRSEKASTLSSATLPRAPHIPQWKGIFSPPSLQAAASSASVTSRDVIDLSEDSSPPDPLDVRRLLVNCKSDSIDSSVARRDSSALAAADVKCKSQRDVNVRSVRDRLEMSGSDVTAACAVSPSGSTAASSTATDVQHDFGRTCCAMDVTSAGHQVSPRNIGLTTRKNPFAIARREWTQFDEERQFSDSNVDRSSSSYVTSEKTKQSSQQRSGDFDIDSVLPLKAGRKTEDSIDWFRRHLRGSRDLGHRATTSSGTGAVDDEEYPQLSDWRKGDKRDMQSADWGGAGSAIPKRRWQEDSSSSVARGAGSVTAGSAARPVSGKTLSRRRHEASIPNTARPGDTSVSNVDSLYGLDVYGECNTAVDLDRGYENFLPKVQKPEDLLKPKSKGIDLNALLSGGRTAGTVAAAVSNTGQSSTAVNKIVLPSTRDTAMSVKNSIPSPFSPSIGQDMATISIDSFFFKLLSLPLASFRLRESISKGVSNASSRRAAVENTSEEGVIAGASSEDTSRPPQRALSQVPIRCQDEDEYIRIFQPLLEAEMEASLREFVESEGNGTTSRRDRKDGGRVWGGAETVGAEQRGKDSVQSLQNHQQLKRSSTAASIPRIYVRCAMLIDRSDINNDDASAALVEARVATVPNKDGGGGGTGVGHNGATLLRDDLVVIIHPDNDKDLNTLRDVLSVKHCLAIVTSQGNISCSSAAGPAGSNSAEYFNQQSLVLLQDTTPPLEATWICIPLLGLSTHIREWNALHSIKSHRLMPLSPYIILAAPVVSSQMLTKLCIQLQRGVGNLSTSSTRSPDEEKLKQVLQVIGIFSNAPVDISVLRSTGVIETLKDISKREGVPSEVKDKLKSVIQKWKMDVKAKHKDKSSKGGNIIAATADAIPCPHSCAAAQWDVLSKSHNNTQLFAIKYVADRPAVGQDTRVCLIQGPPGTGSCSYIEPALFWEFIGKTRTVIGIISCLLTAAANSQQSQPRTHLTSGDKIHTKSENEESVVSMLTSDSEKSDTEGNRDERRLSKKLQSRKSRLMVCAPSNAAVDELLTRIIDNGVVNGAGKLFRPKVVRLGKPLEGTSSRICILTLDSQVEHVVQQDAMWTQLIKNIEDINNINRSLRELEGNIVKGDKTNTRATLLVQLRKLKSAKIRTELYVNMKRIDVRRQILESADIVAATLSSSGQYILLDHILQHDIRFDTVIVDEAGQATEPAALIPLRYGCKRLILVGDVRQLPAYVCSKPAERAGLGMSLFERLEKAGHEVVMLTVQYRMHPAIRQFPSRMFYANKLRDAHRIAVEIAAFDCDKEQGREDSENGDAVGKHSSGVAVGKERSAMIRRNVTCPIVRTGNRHYLNPVMFFDLRSREDASNKSYRNRKEATMILSFLESLAPCLSDMSIAIISPYKSQVHLIRRELEGRSMLSARNVEFSKDRAPSTYDNSTAPHAGTMHIEVNTVDGFQGREKDVVVVSAVRTSTVGFLGDNRRLNVAITRAKRCLVVVGHRATLSRDKLWGALIDDLAARQCVFMAPESGNFREFSGYADLQVGIRAVAGHGITPDLCSPIADSHIPDNGSEDGEVLEEEKGKSALGDSTIIKRKMPTEMVHSSGGDGHIRKRMRNVP